MINTILDSISIIIICILKTFPCAFLFASIREKRVSAVERRLSATDSEIDFTAARGETIHGPECRISNPENEAIVRSVASNPYIIRTNVSVATRATIKVQSDRVIENRFIYPMLGETTKCRDFR